MRWKTWYFESAFAAVTLAVCALLRGSPSDWLSATAVFFTFQHGSVAERLRERQAVKQLADVACHRRLDFYLYCKETLWVAFFLVNKSYPALIGCALFLLYPQWRKWWRRRHPLKLEVS